MKRKQLKCLCQLVVAELRQKSYAELKAVEFPSTFERDEDGEEIQFELVKLEDTEDYLHISVSADCGGLSSYFPITEGLIVPKTNAANDDSSRIVRSDVGA